MAPIRPAGSPLVAKIGIAALLAAAACFLGMAATIAYILLEDAP